MFRFHPLAGAARCASCDQMLASCGSMTGEPLRNPTKYDPSRQKACLGQGKVPRPAIFLDFCSKAKCLLWVRNVILGALTDVRSCPVSDSKSDMLRGRYVPIADIARWRLSPLFNRRR